MAEIGAEVNLEAVLNRTAGAVPSPEAISIRDRTAVRTPDQITGSLQELKSATKNPKQSIDEAISKSRANGRRTAPEQALYNTALKIADRVEKGYEDPALSAADKQEMEVSVESILRSPELSTFFDTFPAGVARDAAIKQVAISFLKDRNFMLFLKRALDRSTDQIPPEIGNEVIAAYMQANAVVANKQGELHAVAGEITVAGNDLTNVWGTAPGSKGEKLGVLSGEKTTFEQAIEDANTKKTTLEGDRTRQIIMRRQAQQTVPPDAAGVGSANAEINRIELEMLATEGELSAAQDEARRFSRTGKLAELNQLQHEKDELTARRDKLRDRVSELNNEILAANQNMALPYAEYDRARLQRASQERAFVKGVEGVFGQATIDYLTAELGKAEKARTDLNEEAKKAVSTNQEAEAARIGKAALDKLNREWDSATKTKKWWGKEVYDTDTTRVDTDMTTLLTSGSEALVRQYLIRIEPALAGPPPDRLNALIANKELMDQLQPQLLESLLAKRLDSTSGMGKMSEADAKRIASSDWGKELITKAIDKNKAMKAQVDAMRAQGAIPGNLAEWVSKRPGSVLLAILAMLFGIGGAAIFGGAIPAIMAGAAEAGAVGAGMAGKGTWDNFKQAA